MKAAMNKLLRKLLVFCGLIAIAIMPTHAGAGCEGGLGGTGNLAKEGGIGGTGNLAGTPGIGGTGIVGAITGFASICVNGLEVQFDEATTVRINGATADTTMLAVGQIIALHAENSTKGLHAHSVTVLHALEGPVTDVFPEHGLVLVMGRAVRITADTRLEGIIAPADLRQGSLVQVSGYKNAQGEVVATRIQLARELRGASAIGIVADDRHGYFALDGMPVSSLAVAPKAGAEALVRGEWTGKELTAGEILLEPSLPFSGLAGRVVAEGLIVGAVARRLHISGFEVEMEGATTISGGSHADLVAGQKVRITGSLEPGRRLMAEHVELVRHGSGSNHGSRPPEQQQPSMKPGAMQNGERGSSPGISTGERPNRLERLERIEKPERMTPPTGMERLNRQHMNMGRTGGK